MAKRKKHKRHRDLLRDLKVTDDFVELFGQVKIPIHKGDFPDDKEFTIVGGGSVFDEPLVPSELRPCAGTCGEDIWISKANLYKAIQHRKYQVMCLPCCVNALEKQKKEKEEDDSDSNDDSSDSGN